MKLIVGLGNPGSQYAKTRHNVGFMAIDRLAARHGFAPPKSKFNAAFFDGYIANQRCLLLQPMTYMNRSGQPLGDAARFFKIDTTTDLLVIVDDLALPCGQFRLRPSGGTGGHNGLADIRQSLGSNDFPRLRIGIDPATTSAHQADYVLTQFSKEQWAATDPAIDRAADAAEHWCSHPIDQTMTRYNNTSSQPDD